MTPEQLEAEKKEIARRYRGLLRSAQRSKEDKDRKQIRKAFDISVAAHSTMRRKTGEPYIYHPIAVARICAEEMGLDTTSVVCALLHDTVEDTYITLEDINKNFGEKEMQIIDGLTKISGVFEYEVSRQAENFRKMLLTLSDDVRVILIKLADRLHNMRTLDSMALHKQQKIASETLFMYAPLAHRLGLYNIKTELEDLSLKYKEPEAYQEIIGKLQKTKAVRTRFINKFKLPIMKAMDGMGIQYEIKSRTKSVFSIWNKISQKGVPFEEIYDVFAIRIILDVPPAAEKPQSWQVYSMVTDFYLPNPERLRDWISQPKSNGYESLHTTVMSPTGKWVEVQIRSKRMDEMAEKGYAAHWKYKNEDNVESNLDHWLGQIREVLESASENAMEFIDNFKLNLFSEEIYVFTPNGDLRTLPKGATALDFAFDIHTQVGANCIGAKVNHKLVPLSAELKSGDQVEVLTSKNQLPKEGWLDYAVTAKARNKIKSALKEAKKKIAQDGKETLRRKLKSLKVDFLSKNISVLEVHYAVPSALELYYKIAEGKIDLKKLKGYTVENGMMTFPKEPEIQQKRKSEGPKPTVKKDTLLIGDDKQQMDYSLAKCCNPIAGDAVFGFITINEGIKIHRNSCPNATELLGKFAYRTLKAEWAGGEASKFATALKFSGIDDIGLVNKITNVISSNMHVDMKAISFESNDGIFTGKVTVLVTDTNHLDELRDRLKEVSGVHSVMRTET